MKYFLAILLTVVLLGALVGGLKVRDYVRDRDRDATQALRARDRALDSAETSLNHAKTTADSLRALREALRGERARASARERSLGDSLRGVADSLYATLRHAIPAPEGSALDTLRGMYLGVIAGRDSIIVRDALSLRDALADEAACRAAYGKLTEIAEGWRKSSEEWQRRAHPSFWKKLTWWVPPFVAGAVVIKIADAAAKIL